jgi:hypothetical protein
MPQRDDPKPGRTDQSGDDFQKIARIGRTRAERLRKAGILTYDDLARRSPEEVAEMTGISAELIAKENWAGQARKLAGPPAGTSVPRQHHVTFYIEFLVEPDNRVGHTKISHHRTNTSDDWSGWDEEKLLTFMRTHVPLPAASRFPDTLGPEAAQAQVPEQAPESAPAAPASRSSPPAPTPQRPPPWSLSFEELAPVRGDQRNYTRGPSEPNSARLTMRINPADTLSHDTFDFSATIEARTFGRRDRSPLGTTRGTIRVSDPVSVTVTGTALPVGQYQLVATVEIYSPGHSPKEPPLLRGSVSGDLMRVADPPPDPAQAVA